MMINRHVYNFDTNQ